MEMDRRSALHLFAGTTLAAGVGSPHSVTRLSVDDPLPRFDLLKPGSHSFLISSIKDGRHIAQSIWKREVRFERFDGRPMLRISQHSDGVGTPPTLVRRESLFEIGSFKPSIHTRITEKDGERLVEGFLFGRRSISGLPGLEDNIRGDFSVVTTEPMYNFETDIELLKTLPWRQGFAVSIPFFHPAPGSVPARYLWTVAAEEALVGPDGEMIQCWIVTCDYNKGGAPTRFWLAKHTHQLIKMEGQGADGAIRRKTLLF